MALISSISGWLGTAAATVALPPPGYPDTGTRFLDEAIHQSYVLSLVQTANMAPVEVQKAFDEFNAGQSITGNATLASIIPIVAYRYGIAKGSLNGQTLAAAAKQAAQDAEPSVASKIIEGVAIIGGAILLGAAIIPMLAPAATVGTVAAEVGATATAVGAEVVATVGTTVTAVGTAAVADKVKDVVSPKPPAPAVSAPKPVQVQAVPAQSAQAQQTQLAMIGVAALLAKLLLF